MYVILNEVIAEHPVGKHLGASQETLRFAQGDNVVLISRMSSGLDDKLSGGQT